jgi:hypothetical protein
LLAERDYRVIEIAEADLEADTPAVLDRLAAAIDACPMP